MTLKRNCYFRRKEDKIVAEGKQNNKTIFLFTLPDVDEVAKSSLFSQEKQKKILEKISRLDYRPEKKKSKTDELPTTIIRRTLDLDDEDDVFDTSEIKKGEIEELKKVVDDFDF